MQTFNGMKVPSIEEDVSGSRGWMKQSRWLRQVQRGKLRSAKFFALFCIVVLLVIPVVWWWIWAEAFLSLTRRLSAEVLVVEGWIGPEGIRAAGTEFVRHDYQYVVATGAQTDKRSGQSRSTYAEIIGSELIQSGVPQDRIIVAPAGDPKGQRTYQSAVAAWRALRAKGVCPKAINVFTRGTHARRSRLVFAKVSPPGTEVGVVSWVPSDYEAAPWWQSSERSKCMLKEPVGYLFEALFNFGRPSNPPSGGIPDA